MTCVVLLNSFQYVANKELLYNGNGFGCLSSHIGCLLTCLIMVGCGVCGRGYNASCEVKPESCDDTLDNRIVPVVRG